MGKKDKMDKIDELERFRREVKDARELLRFAISEGVDVPDGIIQEINEAAEFLDGSKHPSHSQRVAFDKAYRDLVKLLDPVTLKSLRASYWLPKWALPLVFLIIFAVLVFVSKVSGIEWTEFRIIFGFCLISFCGTFFIWFLDLFTGVIAKARFIEIILFCYVFTFSALIGSILMFAILGWQGSVARGAPAQRSTSQGSGLEALTGFMYRSPIGVVKGCSTGKSDIGESANDWIPWELECRDKNEDNFSQWVINVGGTIIKAEAQGNDARLWTSVKINGGVVVPLYVVILSLMGAAISMTRRVPEYQRRVLFRENVKEYLSREHARECLVFQIMQFFTAPLLAITAYYLLTPDTRAISVALGFASGFASETVLHAIRALVEKLNPSPAQAEGSVGEGTQRK